MRIDSSVELANICLQDISASQSTVLGKSRAIMLRPPSIDGTADSLGLGGSGGNRVSRNAGGYRGPTLHHLVAQKKIVHGIANA